MNSIKKLYSRLKREDAFRTRNPFSEEFCKVHEIVFNPYRTDTQREEAYLLWLQRHQPCLFGRIAAAQKRLHFCFLGEAELLQSDEYIKKHIQQQRVAWKRRSLQPHAAFSSPAHGFLLIAASQKLALAAPDEALQEFSAGLLSLWGVAQTEEASGTVHSETLFLKHPQKSLYIQFRFSVDFFMAQGDGRWWHDHRIPGGIAFTANSVGHMRKFREWYEKMSEQEDWVLQTAMLTINSAADTPHGKATWLRPLINDKPLVKDLKCPFAHPEKLREQLRGKDWTRYGGHLHTDHAIREEFFWQEPEKVAEITKEEYIQDFAYLYDPRQRDNVLFIQGQNIAESEVFGEIGNPADYARITAAPTKVGARPIPLKKPQAAPKGVIHPETLHVETLLNGIRSWAIPTESTGVNE